MKNTFIIIALIFTSTCFAQQSSPEVVNSTGSSITDGTLVLEYSIGEIAITTISSGDNFLTQGFLQGEEDLLTGIFSPDVSSNIEVATYPNPSRGGVFKLESSEEIEKVVVTDVLGRTETFTESNSIETSLRGILTITVWTAKGIISKSVQSVD